MPKYVCTCRCQIGEHIYRVGETAVFENPNAHVLASFAPAEDDEKPAGPAAATEGETAPASDDPHTRADFMQRLDEMKIAYSPRASLDTLRELYMAQVAGPASVTTEG